MRSLSSEGRNSVEVRNVNPFVAADVRRWIDAFAFDKLIELSQACI